MGTRADFYVGTGKHAEWIGSLAWDGYPWNPRSQAGIPPELLACTTERDYRTRVAYLLEHRDDQDGTVPSDGWPWPWNDSHTTDYAYMFVDGKVLASYFGSTPFDPQLPEPENPDKRGVSFPNMQKRKRVSLGKRSGIMMYGRHPDGSIGDCAPKDPPPEESL